MSKNLLDGSKFIQSNMELPKLIGITQKEYLEYKNQKKEKQDLIKYLEDKIGKIDHEVFKEEQLGILTSKRLNKLKCEKEPYQEILDKIKEGNYE